MSKENDTIQVLIPIAFKRKNGRPKILAPDVDPHFHARVQSPPHPARTGAGLRDYIHVNDLVRAHMDALRRLRAGGGNVTCNVGYGQGYSVLEVIDAVRRVSGVDFEVRRSGRRAGDPARIVASNGRIRRELGWTPRHDDLEDIVRQALEWERGLEKRLVG